MTNPVSGMFLLCLLTFMSRHQVNSKMSEKFELSVLQIIKVCVHLVNSTILLQLIVVLDIIGVA